MCLEQLIDAMEWRVSMMETVTADAVHCLFLEIRKDACH